MLVRLFATAVIAGIGTACSEGADLARTRAAACEAGDAAACVELGTQYLRGHQVLSDWRHASALYDQACTDDNAEGCARLAWMHVHSRGQARGVRQDTARAVALYERACDGGGAFGCAALAEHYVQTDSVVEGVEPTGPLQDFTRAAELFGRACEGGDTRGCVRLGMLHEEGRGVVADTTRALALFTRACGESDPLGCAHLGRALELGLGTETDVERAAALYTESCEAEMTGCLLLARLHERGVAVERDLDRALDLYETACWGNIERDRGSAGVGESCFRAAELFATGSGGEGQRYRAIQFYRQACRMGYEQACEREG